MNRHQDLILTIICLICLGVGCFEAWDIDQKDAVIKRQAELIADYQESLADAVIAVKAVDSALKSANAVMNGETLDAEPSCVSVPGKVACFEPNCVWEPQPQVGVSIQ